MNFRPTAALAALLLLSGCASMPFYGSQSISSEPPAGDQRRQMSGENRNHPQVTFKKGPGFVDPKIQPYSVMGKTYWPVQSAMGFREEGFASWYGIDFHGKKTATGEVYDMFGVSAAHKTLPLGTKVRVHNLENGRTLDLVINDRGPFVDGRVIDLSYASARLLGMADNGLARVRVEGLEENPALAGASAKTMQASRTDTARRPAPPSVAQPTFVEKNITDEPLHNGSVHASGRPVKAAPAKSVQSPKSVQTVAAVQPQPKPAASQAAVSQADGRYTVQVGAFSQEDNARRVKDKLVQAGFRGARVTRSERGGKVLSVVHAGNYERKEAAEEALRTVKQEFPASFISTGA